MSHQDLILVVREMLQRHHDASPNEIAKKLHLDTVTVEYALKLIRTQ